MLHEGLNLFILPGLSLLLLLLWLLSSIGKVKLIKGVELHLQMANCKHHEDLRKEHVLVISLAKEIDIKNGKLMKMENMLEEKDRLLQAYNEGINNLEKRMLHIIERIMGKASCLILYFCIAL